MLPQPARAGRGVPPPHAASAWPAILLVVGAGIVSAFQVGKAPTALAAVRADLALDLATASWLLSAFAVIGAVGGAFIGLGVDRLGARRLVIGGLLLQALCSALGALAMGAPALLATRAIEGIGFLTVTVAAPTLVVALATTADRGRAMAVWGTFMPLGIAVVMLAAPLLAMTGWRGFWLLNAAVLLGYALLVAGGTRGLAGGTPAALSILGAVKAAAGAAGPWLLGGIMALFGAAIFAIFGFLPAILAERLGVTTESASLLAAGAVAANVVGNLACGPLLARGLGRATILGVGFAGMALAGFAILGPDLPGPLVYAACVAFSMVGGLIPVALLDGAARHAPHPELVGATVGFVMQGNNIGLVAGPALTGAVAAAHGWTAVPLLIAALAVAGIGLALALGRRSPERAP